MKQLLDQLDRRKIMLLAWSGILLIVAGFSSKALIPKFKANRAAHQSLELLNHAAQNTGNLNTALNSLQSKVTQLEQELHGDMQGLPLNQMEAFVVGRLQSISWNKDVRLVSVEPSPSRQMDEFIEISFSVELNGSYFDLYRWLNDLTEELGFVVVQEYEMVPLSGQDKEPVLAVRLTMASYRKERV